MDDPNKAEVLDEESARDVIEFFRLLDQWARKADGETATLDHPFPTDPRKGRKSALKTGLLKLAQSTYNLPK